MFNKTRAVHHPRTHAHVAGTRKMLFHLTTFDEQTPEVAYWLGWLFANISISRVWDKRAQQHIAVGAVYVSARDKPYLDTFVQWLHYSGAISLQRKAIRLEGAHHLIGKGIYYNPSLTELHAHAKEPLFLFGNNTIDVMQEAYALLQAGVHHMTVLLPGETLLQELPPELVTLVEAHALIQPFTRVRAVYGADALERLMTEDVKTHVQHAYDATTLFIYDKASLFVIRSKLLATLAEQQHIDRERALRVIPDRYAQDPYFLRGFVEGNGNIVQVAGEVYLDIQGSNMILQQICSFLLSHGAHAEHMSPIVPCERNEQHEVTANLCEISIRGEAIALLATLLNTPDMQYSSRSFWDTLNNALRDAASVKA